ncbi:precorrin-3B synthase [Halomonas huangheensis]|uniref:Nitrite/Sulfite reductase ferredoxin-like domain-containing protein n=1 Tax=Halomonas huangheensis TaxID=1178482 RepID=W1N4W4_9GAMM|nr:precorrin-3B synthase [Halomonas huangheensis]ALM52056.1 cobalamin biosynthesis protein CobG [Halomonas huangheensis]ERL50612.1 hypothetical protein BJB45_05640 [Halomonas huangheensis]
MSRGASTAPLVKGWCPGAWQPMASGDGLLVRVRPFHGRLTRQQMLALCQAAQTFGSGLIEVTNRANLQLRGVTRQHWPELLACLAEQGLLDPDPEAERRRNLLVAPDWQPGDDTQRLAEQLTARLDELPALPGKVGFAIDAGVAPMLSEVSADFRIERAASSSLLVRADGRAQGLAVASPDEAISALLRLAQWFIDSGGNAAGRMRRHRVPLPDWAEGRVSPAPIRKPLALGQYPLGMVVGIPFGRVAASTLAEALQPTTISAVRVTAWRRLLIEGVETDTSHGLPMDERDPRLAVDACPGAPYCAQASVATQALAEHLGGRVAGSVHVSGCAKGCARQCPATLCLVGNDGRFDLVVDGRADDRPLVSGLSAPEVLDYLDNFDNPIKRRSAE